MRLMVCIGGGVCIRGSPDLRPASLQKCTKLADCRVCKDEPITPHGSWHCTVDSEVLVESSRLARDSKDGRWRRIEVAACEQYVCAVAAVTALKHSGESKISV